MLRSAIGSIKSARRTARGRDTAGEILDAAEELLQRRGFNAFSYHHIAVRLGVRHAAVHYHYPAKEDLGLALINRYRERFADWCATAAALPDARVRLQAYFKRHLEFLDGGVRCCPAGVLSAEFDALPDGMREGACNLVRDHYEWLSATLEQGHKDGVFRYTGRAADKAAEVSAALQGGLQIARLAGPERFHQVLAQLTSDLTGRGSYPAPGARSST